MPQDLKIDYRMIIDRLGDERIRADMGRMNIRDIASFINRLIITEEGIAQYTKGAPLHTDDNALLEYSAPKALVRGRSVGLLKELYRYRSKPVDMLRSLRWVEIATGIEDDLLERFEAGKEVLSGYINCYSNGPVQDTIKRFEAALCRTVPTLPVNSELRTDAWLKLPRMISCSLEANWLLLRSIRADSPTLIPDALC